MMKVFSLQERLNEGILILNEVLVEPFYRFTNREELGLKDLKQLLKEIYKSEVNDKNKDKSRKNK